MKFFQKYFTFMNGESVPSLRQEALEKAELELFHVQMQKEAATFEERKLLARIERLKDASNDV